MSKGKRVYNSEKRQAQAAETRQRVLASAKELFQAQGFESVTIQQLAKAAGVAAPTIYALYRSKRGVLQAVIDSAMAPGAFEALTQEAMDPRTSVQRVMVLSAMIARQMYDAERSLMDLLCTASVISPELKKLEREREDRRYARQETSVRNLFDSSRLKSGLSVDRARDILWMYTGRDMYRMLVIERGWSSDQYEVWLSESLRCSLLNSQK